MQTSRKQNVAIIGAGISGISLGRMINSQSNVTIFEKSTKVGGRVSTKYTNDLEFDHGAQFFTIRTNSFMNYIQLLIDEGIVDIWKARFVEIDQNNINHWRHWSKEHPHYVGVPRMNMICKYLANGIVVNLNTEVKTITKVKENKWRLFDANNINLGEFDWVISAIPAAQATKLLPLEFLYSQELSTVKMHGCYALMLHVKNITIDWDAALVKNSNISWISNNSSKPGRESFNNIVALANNVWSDNNMTHHHSYIKSKMIESLLKIIDFSPSKLIRSDIHKWQYANIGINNNYKYLLDKNNKLGAIGDWCIQGRIESAFVSAESLYNEIKNIINQ